MDRREFLTGAAAALSAAGTAGAEAEAGQDLTEFYELRRMKLRRGPVSNKVDDYNRDALIPALNRLGLGPVGVFNVAIGPDSPTQYRLIPHRSLQTIYTVGTLLAGDAEYRNAGAEFLNLPASDSPYVEVESWLLAAFKGMPKLEVPRAAEEKKPRLLELRTYESHSFAANSRKVEMFNQGEIALFRKAGLTPVFFGQAIIGSRLPNLTYMLVHDDLAGRERSWAAFGGDPEWRKMASTPGLTDAEIITNISSILLRPASYSQI